MEGPTWGRGEVWGQSAAMISDIFLLLDEEKCDSQEQLR